MATGLETILQGLQGQTLTPAQLAALQAAGLSIQGQQDVWDANAMANIPAWVAYNPVAGGFTGGTPTAAQISTPLGSIGDGGAYGSYSMQLVQNPDGSYSVADAAPTWNASANNADSTLLDKFGSNLNWIGPLAIALATYGAGAGAAGAGQGASTTGNALGTTGSDWASGLATTGGEWGTTGYNLMGTPELAIGQGAYAAPAAAGAVTSSVGAAPAVASGAGTGATSTMSDTALRNAAFGDPSFNSPSVSSSGGGLLSKLLSSPAAGPLAGAALGALSGSQDKTQTQTSAVDPATAAYQQAIRDRATAAANIPFEPYSGQMSAGLSSGQTQAGNLFQSQASGLSNLMNQINALIGSGTTNLSAAQNQQLDAVKSLISGATAAQSATTNPLANLNNPQLQAMIDAAQQDLTRSYSATVAPTFARGSSFGNSGLAQAEVNSRNDLMRQLGLIDTNLRFQDYGNQQQLLENFAQRQDTINNAIRSAGIQGASLLGSLGENYAGRQDTMATGNADRSLQGATALQNAQNLYSTIGNNLLNFGNIDQQTQQNALNASYQEFLRRIGYPQQQLSILQSGLGSPTSQTSTATTPGNLWTGLAGGAIVGTQIQNMLNNNTSTPATTSTSKTSSYTSPLTFDPIKWDSFGGQSTSKFTFN